MVPAKALFRMHVGRSSTLSGQSGQYGEKYEPRIKCSERPELHAGLIPWIGPWTGAHQLVFGFLVRLGRDVGSCRRCSFKVGGHLSFR